MDCVLASLIRLGIVAAVVVAAAIVAAAIVAAATIVAAVVAAVATAAVDVVVDRVAAALVVVGLLLLSCGFAARSAPHLSLLTAFHVSLCSFHIKASSTIWHRVGCGSIFGRKLESIDRAPRREHDSLSIFLPLMMTSAMTKPRRKTTM